MKLCICVVHNRDKNRIVDELVQAGFKFTIIGSTGGFLREGNTTLLIGVPSPDVPSLLELIEQHANTREQMVNATTYETSPTTSFIPAPIKVSVGGAVVFILDVEQFSKF